MKPLRFKPSGRPMTRDQRLNGLIRLMENIHKKSPGAEQFLGQLQAKYKFLPQEVLTAIWKEEISPMDKIKKKFGKKPAHEIARLRAFLLKERLRNIAIAILEHEIRKTN